MSGKNKTPFLPLELILFIEICAEKAGISTTRNDLINHLGSKILQKLEIQDLQESGGKSLKSEKIGRNTYDWLKKSRSQLKLDPNNPIKISACQIHMRFIGVESLEDFKEKYSKRIEEKRDELIQKESENRPQQPNWIYKFRARILPATLSFIPLILTGCVLSLEYLERKYAFTITGLIIILWPLLSELLYRVFVSNSKKLEEQLFLSRKMFPTTELLLWENSFYSKQHKVVFSKKVQEEFGLSLPTQKLELEDKKEAIAEINSVIAMVKSKMINHPLVLNHNISYGFTRNLIGGVPFAIGSSLIGLAIGIWLKSYVLAVLLSLILIGLMILYWKRKNLLKRVAFSYARQLIDEYSKS